MIGFPILAILSVITTFQFTMNIYRFEGNYVEAWYQVPLSQIISPEESLSTLKDTIFKKYSYRLNIYSKEKDDMPITDWGRPLEIWHYYAQGYRVMFCDKNCDGTPVIIKIFRPEAEDIDDETWLFDIAPGTYKRGIRQYKEKQSEE